MYVRTSRVRDAWKQIFAVNCPFHLHPFFILSSRKKKLLREFFVCNLNVWLHTYECFHVQFAAEYILTYITCSSSSVLHLRCRRHYRDIVDCSIDDVVLMDFSCSILLHCNFSFNFLHVACHALPIPAAVRMIVK